MEKAEGRSSSGGSAASGAAPAASAWARAAQPAPRSASPLPAGDPSESLREERQAMKELWDLYQESVLPAEELCFFDHFRQRPITEQEFLAKPQVLLLGQYSTGKTSMIKWLTGVNSVHFDVKPEPSTDKFMAVMHGTQERLILGNAATSLRQAPYQGLSIFGSDFLQSFQALSLQSDVLKDITLIDTPGVLPNKGHSVERNYDFAAVCAWLAERADMVLLMFDAHKLDISDEFQRVMEVLRPHADKCRCLLNKADQIGASNLLRVYGALLWNVGKVMRTPEVTRVLVSSFWDKEYGFKEHRQLFDEDKQAVLAELRDLPRATVLRHTHKIVERMRRVRAHYCILSYIRSQIPWGVRTFGSEERWRRWLMANVERLMAEAQRLHKLSAGDMPRPEGFSQCLETLEGLKRLPSFDAEVVEIIRQAIDVEVPRIINQVHGVSAGEMARPDGGSGGGGQRPGFLERLGLAGPSRPAKRRRVDS